MSTDQLESMTSDYKEAYERAKDVLKNPTIKPEERAALRFLLALENEDPNPYVVPVPRNTLMWGWE